MARQTSIEAYNMIKENGLLSKRRMECYDTMFHKGPLSQNQLWRILKKRNGVEQSSINPRFAELEKMGLFREVGVITDEVTNTSNILWDVTANLPRDLPKKLSKKQKVDEVLRLITVLGKSMPDQDTKKMLREIYKKVNKL